MKRLARVETVARAVRQRLAATQVVGAIKQSVETHHRQQQVCAEYQAPWTPPVHGAMVAVARDVGTGTWPVNGLRHPMEGTSCGWYLWAGEGDLDQSPDYFQPVHVEHLHDLCPEVVPYLGLPPGWRFLIAPGYSDVWEDPDLLILDE